MNTSDKQSLESLISAYESISDSEWKSDDRSKDYSSKDSYIQMLKRKLRDIDEATTTSAVGGISTPFAFSRNKIGNVRAAKQLGYKLANVARRKLKNDELSEFNDISHLDPNLITYKDTIMPTTENKKLLKTIKHIIDNKCLKKESNTRFKFEQEGDVDIKSYDIQADFTEFDQKLKDSTEELKTTLQKKLNSKLANKKIVVRASKGYKQPESDYKVNVMGVEIDYYYDRYMIIIVGRQENKQKTQRFFVKPGFKIKILGSADVSDSDMQKMQSAQNILGTDSDDSNVVTKSQSEPNITEPESSEPEAPEAPEAPETEPEPEVGEIQPSNIVPPDTEEEEEEEEDEDEEEEEDIRPSTIQESFDKHVNLFKNKL